MRGGVIKTECRHQPACFYLLVLNHPQKGSRSNPPIEQRESGVRSNPRSLKERAGCEAIPKRMATAWLRDQAIRIS